MSDKGIVYLIGAGPGDPGLFTLKGKRILEQADVIVYDRLLGDDLFRYVKPDAERIYVGKASGNHALPQDGINALLAEKAAEGKVVARLKGGDPYVFGRGGEEALYLEERGLDFEVVPGVSSAVAVPAYAGIPVSHRDLSSSFAVITGHEKPGKTQSSINWPNLARAVDTLVFLMGVENLPFIRKQLLENGRDSSTPVALIKWGTLSVQQAVVGTLNDIEQKVEESGITSPAVIIVGPTVGLRERLNWFEKRPLFGRRIIVTRSRSQASQLVQRLQELGADTIEIPAIEIEKNPDLTELHRVFANLGDYQWLIFTSANGVAIFFEELKAAGLDIRRLAGIKVAAIGPATAEALHARGLFTDLVPAEYRAEGLLEGLTAMLQSGDRVLLPRAAGAREILPDTLAQMGAIVDEIHIYRSRLPEISDAARSALRDADADYVTFTSSSTVDNFAEMLGQERIQQFSAQVKAACIGPITAERARQAGFQVSVEAAEYTISGLIEAIQADLYR